MTTWHRTTRLGVGLMIASLFLGLGIWTDHAGANGTRNTLGRPKKPQGVLARPSSQAGVDSSSSSVSKAMAWTTCSVADDCTLAFDYLVDSEYGYDQLRVWLDSEATPRFSISGQATGRKVLKGIPAGTHTVRFEYYKDVSLSRGADLAWVDNIVARYTGGRAYYSSCDEVWSVENTPTDWTGSGLGNGWRIIEPAADRSLQRPASQYHSPSTYSYAQRNFTVTGESQPLQFDYFVDSEPKDYLLVLLNGSLVWQRAGREQRGTAEISLPVGYSTVTFAYQKDSADDAGLDVATIDNLRVLDHGRLIPIASFDSMKPGDLPGAWYSPSPAWQVRAKAAHITRLDADAATSAPVVDGTANAGEYSTQASGTSLFRYIYKGSAPAPDPMKPEKDTSGKLVLEASQRRMGTPMTRWTRLINFRLAASLSAAAALALTSANASAITYSHIDRLRILNQNIANKPWPWNADVGPCGDDNVCRAVMVARRVKQADYDVVVFEEQFDAISMLALVVELGAEFPYHVGQFYSHPIGEAWVNAWFPSTVIPGADPVMEVVEKMFLLQNSGLVIFSKWPAALATQASRLLRRLVIG